MKQNINNNKTISVMVKCKNRHVWCFVSYCLKAETVTGRCSVHGDFKLPFMEIMLLSLHYNPVTSSYLTVKNCANDSRVQHSRCLRNFYFVRS